MRLVVGRLAEEGLVGRDDGQVARVGQGEQRVLGREPPVGTLDLDIEPVAEGGRERVEPRGGDIGPPFRERHVDRAALPARQRDQPGGVSASAAMGTTGGAPRSGVM